jgi:hypothetical protein
MCRSHGVLALGKRPYSGRDILRSGHSRSACERVTAGPLASSPCAGRSGSPSSGASNAWRTSLGQDRRWQPNAPPGARTAASSETDLGRLGPETEPAPVRDRCCANTRRATAVSARSIRTAPADRSSSGARWHGPLCSREAPHHRRAMRRDRIPRNLLSIARLKRAKSRARSSGCNLARMDQTCPGRSGGLGPIILHLFHGDRELPVLGDDRGLESFMGVISSFERPPRLQR